MSYEILLLIQVRVTKLLDCVVDLSKKKNNLNIKIGLYRKELKYM